MWPFRCRKKGGQLTKADKGLARCLIPAHPKRRTSTRPSPSRPPAPRPQRQGPGLARVVPDRRPPHPEGPRLSGRHTHPAQHPRSRRADHRRDVCPNHRRSDLDLTQRCFADIAMPGNYRLGRERADITFRTMPEQSAGAARRSTVSLRLGRPVGPTATLTIPAASGCGVRPSIGPAGVATARWPATILSAASASVRPKRSSGRS